MDDSTYGDLFPHTTPGDLFQDDEPRDSVDHRLIDHFPRWQIIGVIDQEVQIMARIHRRTYTTSGRRFFLGPSVEPPSDNHNEELDDHPAGAETHNIYDDDDDVDDMDQVD